jgi:hypothetical protein
VHGSGPTVVPGVQRHEQIDHFGTSELTNDKPVRAHPHRLPHQLAQAHTPSTLDVGRTGNQPHDVRVIDDKLGGVLDDQQPLPRRDQAEQRAQ